MAVEVEETDEYSQWFEGLKDLQARARILARIRNLSLGNPGDVGPVGEGISELKIHYGPGCRIYWLNRGDTLVILLGGGDKSTQKADIKAAKATAKAYRGRN